MKYYRSRKIDATHAQYRIIIGQRSNGKGYQVLENMLKQYQRDGSSSVYLRRWGEDIKSTKARTIFEPLIKDGLISKYTDGIWDGVYYYSSAWYFCKADPDHDGKVIKSDKPFCYGLALNEMEHVKSASFPSVRLIFFDEFLTRFGYLIDEFVIFMNELSTIIRQRDNVIIYMVGNTVSKDCPYFKEMGLNRITDMKPGDLQTYEYGESGLKVAVEFSDMPAKRKPSDVYFAFNNPRLEMITGQGQVWELNLYPHKPVPFRDADIKFIYFIRYNDNLLQCEIVIKDHYNFTFVHPKTTDLKDPEHDLIFDTEASPLYTRSRKINQGIGKSKIVSKIVSYYNNEKIFFSDNETGEIMRSYLQWCKRSNIFN